MPNVRDIRAHLLAQDVIWVGGGSVANLLAVWRVHGLDEVLRECWESGVVLGGVSAGSICWYVGGPTDSYGTDLRVSPPGLGLLPYGNGVHYDSEEQRRPLLHALVADGRPAHLARHRRRRRPRLRGHRAGRGGRRPARRRRRTSSSGSPTARSPRPGSSRGCWADSSGPRARGTRRTDQCRGSPRRTGPHAGRSPSLGPRRPPGRGRTSVSTTSVTSAGSVWAPDRPDAGARNLDARDRGWPPVWRTPSSASVRPVAWCWSWVATARSRSAWWPVCSVTVPLRLPTSTATPTSTRRTAAAASSTRQASPTCSAWPTTRCLASGRASRCSTTPGWRCSATTRTTSDSVDRDALAARPGLRHATYAELTADPAGLAAQASGRARG